MRIRDVLWALLFAFVVGFVTLLLDPENVRGALALGAVTTATVLVVTWPPVSVWLPSVAIERGDGVALRMRGPTRRWAGRNRAKLRKEAMSLASDIFKYIKSLPSYAAWSITEHQAMVKKMSAVTDESAKTDIWSDYVARSTQQSEAEARDLAERFGGRLRYVAEEFGRRGMLTDTETHHLLWESRSLYWIADAAGQIDALARRL